MVDHPVIVTDIRFSQIALDPADPRVVVQAALADGGSVYLGTCRVNGEGYINSMHITPECEDGGPEKVNEVLTYHFTRWAIRRYKKDCE